MKEYICLVDIKIGERTFPSKSTINGEDVSYNKLSLFESAGSIVEAKKKKAKKKKAKEEVKQESND